MNYDVAKAARMAKQSYAPQNKKIGGKSILKTNPGDATAYLLSDNTLVIPGSNSAADYKKYNLRPIGLFRKKLTVRTTMVKSSDGKPIWHQGFLAHAMNIQSWLTKIGKRPKFIIGHSLGAASTQVLSITYGVPGIGFAAPRVCMSEPKSAVLKKCLLVVRDDDIVGQIPEGFHHLGDLRSMATTDRIGHKHKMSEYTALIDANIKAGRIPRTWPQ